MKIRKVVWLFLFTLGLIIIVGCEKETIEEENITKEEIINGIIDACNEIRTVQFEVNITSMLEHSKNESDVNILEMIVDGEGIANIEDKELYVQMTARTKSANSSSTGSEQQVEKLSGIYKKEIYSKENDVYIRATAVTPQYKSDELYEEWVESENSIEYSQIPVPVEVLKTSSIEILKNEKVNGINCYVIKVVFDNQKFWELMTKQRGDLRGHLLGAGSIAGAVLVSEDVLEIFKNVEVTYWISKDTFLPVKEQIEITMNPEIFTSIDKAVVNLAIVYHDYNGLIKMPLLDLPIGLHENLKDK